MTEMNKLSIIGSGNMGGAIVRGLCNCKNDWTINISNRSKGKLSDLKEECPVINVFSDNIECLESADIVILAVKPWILKEVAFKIENAIDYETQTLVSLAGGISIDELKHLFPRAKNLLRVIPDTAISLGRGMSFLSASDETCDKAKDDVLALFKLLGEADFIEERLMSAATALSSCGIAYVLKFIQAATQAGVQLGFRPKEALKYVCATMEGACALIKEGNYCSVQQEIDKVTTPGGMTIKGINCLEKNNFSWAVIDAILKPLEK